MQSICAIITVFKRGKNLLKQLDALTRQTTPPDKYIFCVNNKEEFAKYNEQIGAFISEEKYLVVEFSENLGVWNRFFLAFNVETDLVYILDDDVITGSKRLENGAKELEKKEMIIGSWGSIFNSLENRRDRKIISESSNRPDKLTYCNMSGQSWLFRKETLSKMFSNLPKRLLDYSVCGEELLISWNASKAGVNTYILPMTEDKETRGNVEPNLGHDQNAGFNKYGLTLYQQFFSYCVDLGYNPIRDYKEYYNKTR